ncbi:hypothetical protein BMW23_0728 [Bodo saltans virus]|uniref:Uncharacterized protein n=1 Tax=Bodo saltans virus TaxID=2024608 RepID=A0A2H4UV85_9VIRU|nr:hypothetical protein QJ851_gp0711 [Bodo saltans virus]ATZ80774.1 hypothetical protein BMW23_0728 [Bodo saltans virus]
MENIYNILLSVLLGIIVTICIHKMYTYPRVIEMYKE